MNRLLDDIVHKELSLMRKENLFLQHGLMGYAIFCFWYGRMSQDDKYTKIAERCLMHVCKSVNNKCSLGISDGLSGIGIGICYLCSKNYLEGDPNRLLQGIDDYMFKVIEKGLQQERIENEAYIDSLLDVMLYLNFRLRTDIRKPYEKQILELFFEKILNWSYQNAGYSFFEEPLPSNLSYRLAKFLFILGHVCELNFVPSPFNNNDYGKQYTRAVQAIHVRVAGNTRGHCLSNPAAFNAKPAGIACYAG